MCINNITWYFSVVAENVFKNKEKLNGKSTFHTGKLMKIMCSKSVRSSRMFITKNNGVNEKVPIFSESKTQPTKCALFTYLMLKHATPTDINVVHTMDQSSYVV